ncbi:uncharacterized protein J4E92_004337 [Alternaria infectoria]|uniref:uncharacterized protein n=1 Tax=Alternaria infectoria TaxID=45303 RepID=UPI00221F0B6D|nr:uncharacterized protein J4E92_004337 [Alternaria infectoria]KAI4930505.1 hypothetical protein J4E92_004337 [Alternaria infectoria]
MVGLAAYYTPLPVDVALSEHSRKFYDGTYKWDSEGFTDDAGVYREFDCYDPNARAPTPLPPLCLSDDDEEAGTVEEKIQDGEHETERMEEDSEIFTFASNVKSAGGVITLRRDELFRDHADREYLIGKMESALIESRSKKVHLTLEECCRACGIPEHLNPVEKSPTKLKIKFVTPLKPTKPDPRMFFSPSELSDCPSDISEWDVGKPVLKARTFANLVIDEKLEQGTDEESPQKPTTRGVAQKVKRQKSAARPIKASPTIESLQTGSYIRGTGEASRRRSTRLSSSQGGK